MDCCLASVALSAWSTVNVERNALAISLTSATNMKRDVAREQSDHRGHSRQEVQQPVSWGYSSHIMLQRNTGSRTRRQGNHSNTKVDWPQEQRSTMACTLLNALLPLQALSLIYPGDTSGSVLERIVDEAAEEAYRDARTKALNDGMALEEAQVCSLAASMLQESHVLATATSKSRAATCVSCADCC